MGGAGSVMTDHEKMEINLLVIVHSSRLQQILLQYGEAKDIAATQAAYKEHRVNFIIMTEEPLVDTAERAYRIRESDVALALCDYQMQTSQSLFECLCFVKDCGVPLLSSTLDDYFQPSGALGAICLAYGKHITSPPTLPNVIAAITSSGVTPRAHTREAPCSDEVPSFPRRAAVNPANVFVSYHVKDGSPIVEVLRRGRSADLTMPALTEDTTNAAVNTLSQCGVVIVVITDAYELSASHLNQIEAARHYHIPILPINATSSGKLSDTVALSIAGKLYYRLSPQSAQNDAYSPYPHAPDGCPMIDIILSIEAYRREVQALSTEQLCSATDHVVSSKEISLNKKAAIEMQSLRAAIGSQWAAQVDQAKYKPPTPQAHPAPASLLPEDDTSGLHNPYIQYEVTRMTHKAPPKMVDEFGLPLDADRLDVMISYQWSPTVQNLVRTVYMQGEVAGMRGWLDIWGGMRGNINAAMAAAVESVACLVVFLSNSYQKSRNCCLELRYALQLNKPIIFIISESSTTLVLDPWLQNILGSDVLAADGSLLQRGYNTAGKYLVLDIHSTEMLGNPILGRPRLQILLSAIRKLAAWRLTQPEAPPRDVSRDTYDTYCTILLAKEVLNAQKSSNMSVCSRCSVKFDASDASVKGKCRKHRTYYMGGNIMAGRWVCCGESEKNGAGCEPADHIAIMRKWEVDSHGCHRWVPA